MHRWAVRSLGDRGLGFPAKRLQENVGAVRIALTADDLTESIAQRPRLKFMARAIPNTFRSWLDGRDATARRLSEGRARKEPSVMKATVMYGAHDVRVENVPDARLVEPTDAVVRVTRACICGSDLWPYNSMPATETGSRMGHEFVGIVDAVGSAVGRVRKGDLVVAPRRFGRVTWSEFRLASSTGTAQHPP
jgi:Alcohol dehydrogenase GroES-like domain/Alcohol dehydrogenase GroES-associated